MQAVDIKLDRSSGIPLYLQIVHAVRARIADGSMAPGSRLPSTRSVADDLDVQRKTVVQAFSVLRDEGWVSAGVGQGTFVLSRTDRADVETSERGRASAPDDASATGKTRLPESPAATDASWQDGGSFSWETVLPNADRADDLWQYWLRNPGPAEAIRFTGATADPAHFPTEEFADIVGEVLQTSGARALDYGPAAGYPPLRAWLADRLSKRGIDADPERLLIVNGSQQGLDLIARLLVREGDRVLVEEPSYSNGFRLLQAHGAEVDTVRFDEGGIDIDSLERACQRGPARLLYTMPLFQNPTGLVLEEERIDPILALCDRFRVPIVEDHFDAELVYEGPPPVPIAAHDRRGQVILIGTFSKILFPGLRLGWMVVPRPVLGAIQELKQMTDLSTGLLAQQAMDLYCRRGLLDAHLLRVREVNRRRLRTLLQAMEDELPAEVTWTKPRGGMTVWMQLPGIDSLTLLESARNAGVEFSPGPFFFPNGGGSGFLRICCVRETEDRIREGIRRLGAVLREQMARHPSGTTPKPFL